MKKRIMSAALTAMMAVNTVPVAFYASAAGDMDLAPALNKEDHMQYMNGYEDGTFRPNATITRAEACNLMMTLLAQKLDDAETNSKFSDVEAGAWYTEAIIQLSGYTLINGYNDGTFRPNATITRAEFASILSRFPHKDIGIEQEFTDVPATHWSYNAVKTALANGWITGYTDGTFRPNATITRAEAVTMLNRVLERNADAIMASSGEGIRVMPDVPDSHWAYLAMLEATTDHEYIKSENGTETWTSYEKETTPLAKGWHNIGGELFHVNSTNQFDRNTAVNGLELDQNGRYTTGSKELDKLLTTAAGKAVHDKMTQQQKLRAMYDYAKETFGYLGIGEIDTSVNGWDKECAINMLKTSEGNCYSWGSAFTYLARKVGYDAVVIPGKGISPKGNESVHAWTEITIDGTAYTFDPQIESIYASRYNEQYDLFMKKYGEAEWGYKKNDDSNNTSDPGENQTTELTELMTKVYKNYEFTTPLNETVINQENMKYFLGSDDLAIEEALASEPMLTTHAHSIVLAKMKTGTDIASAKAKIKENIDPRKWICVGVAEENVLVDNVGNTIIVVMDNDHAQEYMNNFKNAMK